MILYRKKVGQHLAQHLGIPGKGEFATVWKEV